MALVLNHQTAAQFAARLRAKYRDATKADLWRLGWRIIRMINAGDITDAQLRNVFEKTVAEYTVFKTKLQDFHDKWEALQASQGE